MSCSDGDGLETGNLYRASPLPDKKIKTQLNAGYILKTYLVNPYCLLIRAFTPNYY
jgi:hypothetical protein